MGVNPNPPKTLGRDVLIDHLVEQTGDGRVIKGDGHGSATLLDRQQVDDEQRISGVRQSEGANLGFASITQIDQFRPSIRTKP